MRTETREPVAEIANQASDPWYVGSILLALIGLADAVYLTIAKYANQLTVCSVVGDCDTVNQSAYSEIMGIPIALLGSVAYLTILVVLLLEQRSRFWGENAVLVVFGLSLVGVLYSAYLTYVEVAVLRAICPFCVLSALTLVMLLVVSGVRLYKDLTPEN